mgnify:FL=1
MQDDQNTTSNVKRLFTLYYKYLKISIVFQKIFYLHIKEIVNV